MTLAAQLGVSRGTVRSGISKLVFEGILERKAGVGTRVSKKNAESGVRAWRSFSREMASKGITVENFQLDYKSAPASADAAQALQVEAGTPLWRLERVRGWDNHPVLQSVSWFHPRLGLKGKESFTRPLYEALEKVAGVRPHHAREGISGDGGGRADVAAAEGGEGHAAAVAAAHGVRSGEPAV